MIDVHQQPTLYGLLIPAALDSPADTFNELTTQDTRRGVTELAAGCQAKGLHQPRVKKIHTAKAARPLAVKGLIFPATQFTNARSQLQARYP
jgi:hypothetical protein